MLLPVSILALVFLSVSSTPSQLRLSHTGYEIISLNEQQSEEEIVASRAGKLPARNTSTESSEASLPNSERSADASEENDETALESAARNSRSHFDYRKWAAPGSKSASESRQPNAIEVSPNLSSGPRSSSGVYLTLGIPRRLMSPKNPRKETPSRTIGVAESKVKFGKSQEQEADYREDRQDPRKPLVATAIGARASKEKRLKTPDPRSRNLEVDPSGDDSAKNRQPDREAVIDSNRIKALVVDAHRGLDLLIGKTDSNELENIGGFGSTSGASFITELPSIQIRNPANYWLPSGSPGIRSPIYSMGFDVLAEDYRDKPVMALNLEDLKEPAGPAAPATGSKSSIGPEPEPEAGKIGSADRSDGFSRSWNVDASEHRSRLLAGSMSKHPSNRRHRHRQQQQQQHHRHRPEVKVERNAGSHVDESEDNARNDISSRSRSFDATGSRCKKMKDVQSLPAFYQFMANFSANVLDNVLEYEARSFNDEGGARKNKI